MPRNVFGSPLWGRDELGLVPPRKVRALPAGTLVGVTAHYTTGEELGREDTFEWWRDIQGFHMDLEDGRGWWDIGYGFGVDRFGNILEGRGVLVQGAHAGDGEGNRTTVGAAFLGDDDPGQDVTPEARLAFMRLAIYVARVAAIGATTFRWFGHRDWKATSCPGDELYDELVVPQGFDLDGIDPTDATILTGRWGEAGPPVIDRTPPSPPAKKPAPAPSPAPSPRRLTMADFEMLKAERDSAGNPVGVGSRGPQVEGLQATLRGFGAKVDGRLIVVDGLFGPKTDEAVRDYQAEHELGVDGIAGPITLGHLYGVTRAG